jgi:alkylhydroperoxidase family enzyme
MVGVDESMLAAVGNNLGSVTPERVQAIVAFGVKAAMSTGDLTDADYDKLRDMGISDSEIVEIVALSGLGVYLNIVADALKIEVDDMIKQGLAA